MTNNLSSKISKLAVQDGGFMSTTHPDSEWLVDGVLPHPSLGELFAKRGAGKTWASLSLGLEMSLAGRWLTPALRCSTKRVLYVDGEMPPALLQERMKGLYGGRRPSGLLWMVSLAGCSSPPNFATEGAWEDLLRGCQELGVDLVIMDNWACLVRGVDENDNKRTAEVMAGPIKMRAAGISVMWVHHAGKAGTQRGASSREDALDYVLALEGEGRAHDPAKFRVDVEKSRRAIKWDAPSVELRAMPEGGLKWVAPEETMPISAKRIRTILKGKLLNESEIRRELGMNGIQLTKGIDWLKEQGMIVRGDRGWTAR